MICFLYWLLFNSSFFWCIVSFSLPMSGIVGDWFLKFLWHSSNSSTWAPSNAALELSAPAPFNPDPPLLSLAILSTAITISVLLWGESEPWQQLCSLGAPTLSPETPSLSASPSSFETQLVPAPLPDPDPGPLVVAGSLSLHTSFAAWFS